MNNKYRLILALILISVFFAIYSYNLPKSLKFTSDFGRDMYQSIKITQGDIVLIGSKMNLGGYFAGPYLYYILAPALLISKFDIASVLYFHTMLFATSLGFFFWVTSQKFNVIKTLAGTIFLALIPIYILSARYPSNGYSYLPLLLILLTYLFFYNFETKLALSIMGIVSGIILNIHPISFLALIFVFFYVLFYLKKKLLFLFFLGGVLITFTPILTFELTHDFVMTKDTFINRSYRSFTEDGNTPQFWLHENPHISSFLFISDKFKKLIALPPIIYFGLGFLIVGLKWLKNKKIERIDLFLFSSMLSSLALLIAVLRFHFEDHYIFSVAFFIAFTLNLILLRSKFWIFLPAIILLAIYSFPVNVYQDNPRNFKNIEQAVKFTVDQKLVSDNTPFNLIQITDAYGLVPTGYEYRFFFAKFGLYPNSEYDYKTAKVLLIFSETPYYDIDKFKMWATEEFGREYFGKRDIYHAGKIDIYRISKE